jgi:N-acyl homoserine lactone hydrolase
MTKVNEATQSVTITPIRVADLLAETERMPVNVHIIDHPDARVLVDTGMTELHRWWQTWIPAFSH